MLTSSLSGPLTFQLVPCLRAVDSNLSRQACCLFKNIRVYLDISFKICIHVYFSHLQYRYGLKYDVHFQYNLTANKSNHELTDKIN